MLSASRCGAGADQATRPGRLVLAGDQREPVDSAAGEVHWRQVRRASGILRDVMPDPKKLLFAVKPPKPIGQMTDAERRAFADSLFENTAAAVGKPVTKRPEGA